MYGGGGGGGIALEANERGPRSETSSRLRTQPDIAAEWPIVKPSHNPCNTK